MWSLRTAARRVTVRTCTLRSSTVGACCTGLDNNIDEKQYSTSHPISVIHHPERASATSPFLSSTIFIHGRNLSSHADTKSTGKESEELEGFSDLDTDTEKEDIGDELVSESDGVPGTEEEELSTEKIVSNWHTSPLYDLLMNSRRHDMEQSLEKWVKEGSQIKKEDVFAALSLLRKKKLFGKALQFMRWLEKSKPYEFTDKEYSSLLNLHAKVHGLYQAEKFLEEEIPQSMHTENVYGSLLASCASMTNAPEAEKIFNKMRDLNFPLTAFACNQLLLLYKRVDKKKIADVLLMMEKENVKPTLFTYKMLIDTKGLVGDIPGMEQLFDTMKEDGIEPDVYLKYLVAKHYIRAGLTEKVEKIAKEMEGGDISYKSKERQFLLNLYADLGRSDDVERVWEACRADPTMSESIAGMWAWAKLGKVEEAEKVFDQMFKRFKNVSPMCYNCMLGIYADKKMLVKAKNLVMKMSDDGIRIGPIALDTLVKLYVAEGDVEKADATLQNWAQKNQNMQVKPLYTSYLSLLEVYAKKGDYHNAEKILFLMKQVGYFGRLRMYELVLSAYINAKVPAYGFRDRLRADNIFPRQVLTSQLLAVDPFKRAPVTEVLE